MPVGIADCTDSSGIESLIANQTFLQMVTGTFGRTKAFTDGLATFVVCSNPTITENSSKSLQEAGCGCGFASGSINYPVLGIKKLNVSFYGNLCAYAQIPSNTHSKELQELASG